MLFLSSWLDNIGTAFLGLLRTLIMLLISGVYQLIAGLYNLFIYMTKINILSGNESLVTDIYSRIQVILSVVMVFYVTLEFIKYIVNPDTFSDKEKGGGSLIKRILVVIVLMAFTPQIFGYAYVLQNRIIATEVIPKVLIKDYNPTDYNDNVGGQFASNLLSLFYKPYVTSEGKTPSGSCDGLFKKAEQVVNENLTALSKNGKMGNATYCIDKAGGDIKDNGENITNPFLIEMGLGGILPLVVGGFMVWVLINYCAEAGRVIIQFVFLQIIAPIPIISYLAPNKEGMFQKWTKQCMTTYFDLFIRLFIMYLVMMLAQLLLKLDVNTIFGDLNIPEGSIIPFFIKIFLIVGLLMFAMKAPAMVKELLPSSSNAASGDFGLGMKSAKERFSTAGRVAGAAGGAVAAGGIGALSRAAHGARGFKNIGKEMEKARRNGKNATWAAIRTGAGATFNTVKGLGVGAVGGVGRGAWNGGKSGNIFKNTSAGVKSQLDSNKRFGDNVENQYGFLQRTGDRVRAAIPGVNTRVENIDRIKLSHEARIKVNDVMVEQRKVIMDQAEKKVKEGEGRYGREYLDIAAENKNMQEGRDSVARTFTTFNSPGSPTARCADINAAVDQLKNNAISGLVRAPGESENEFEMRKVRAVRQVALSNSTPADVARILMQDCEKDAKDYASYAYLEENRASDGVIAGAFNVIQSSVRAHNNDTTLLPSDLVTELDKIDPNHSGFSGKGFSDHVKKTITQSSNDLRTRSGDGIIDLDRRKAEIEKQMSGNSSNNGGKK